jgi:large subunit ribosomal protein L24
MKIKKNDIVQVISGESKGKQGKVLKVYPATNRVIIEGVNMVKKHTKPNAKFPQGGIINQEAPIQVSNVMLVCPHTNEPTRVGRKRLEDGKLVRYSKKSPAQEIIE